MKTAIKEGPLSLVDDLVRAVLEDRKTQTRRMVNVANLKPSIWIHDGIDGFECLGNGVWSAKAKGFNCYSKPFSCPFGKPGDRLWVRESAKVNGFLPNLRKMEVIYSADGAVAVVDWPQRIKQPKVGHKLANGCYREAARILLEITDVRVELLQDISEEDAIAEGAPKSHPAIDHVSQSFGYKDFSRSWFAQVWDSIYGLGSWDANPWVWVVEFERCT